MTFDLSLPTDAARMNEFYLLALAIYREARGEILLAKRGVGWAIRNRVDHPSWYGKDWASVILKPFQFSSFNRGEINSVVFPGLSDPQAWQDSVTAAIDARTSASTDDPTGGATFYFDKSLDSDPPGWSKEYRHTVDIGNFHFYAIS